MHLLHLFGSEAVLFGCVLDRLLLFLFQVKVQSDLVHCNFKILLRVQHFAIFAHCDRVLAGIDTQREILALLVSLQVISAAVVIVVPHHLRVG